MTSSKAVKILLQFLLIGCKSLNRCVKKQQESACQGGRTGSQEHVTTGQGGSKGLRRIEKQVWIDSVYGQSI